MSIRFNNVSKSFSNKAVLRQVSFEVSQGEILFILGKSGAGKSVTLKNVVGIIKPDSGRIFVDDQEVTSANESDLSDIRKKCGMIFQQPALLDSLNVFENIAFGLRRFDLSQEETKRTVLEKLELVNLGSDILYRYPSEISFGTQKRVSIARSLAPGPSYLLFDEPTTGLDPISTHRINDLISGLSRKLKVTSIVVSHDMSSALEVADKILVLDQGSVLAHGTVSEIKDSSESLIQEFLSEALKD